MSIEMSIEIWANITMGITILVAIAISHHTMMRDLKKHREALRRQLSEPIRPRKCINAGLSCSSQSPHRTAPYKREMSELRRELGGRIDTVGQELVGVRERLGRVEGLLDAFRLNWPEAGEERGNDMDGPTSPQS